MPIRPAYRSTLFNGGEPVVSAEFQFDRVRGWPSLPPLGPARASAWSGPELYTTGMFHGPVFQSVRRIVGWNEAGIDAELFEAGLADFFVVGQTPRLVLNPVLLDAVGQVAAYWVAQQAGVDFNCFPSTIERIELYTPCPAGLPGLTMQRPPAAARSRSDRRLGTAQLGLRVPRRARRTAAARRRAGQRLLPGAARFYEVRRDPLRGLLGQPRAAAAERRRVAVGGAALQRGLLRPVERHLPAHPRACAARRRGAGRMAGATGQRASAGANGCSDARRSRRRCGWLIPSRPGSFSIRPISRSCTTSWARRCVDGWWRGQLAEAPHVSLSHGDAWLVARCGLARRAGRRRLRGPRPGSTRAAGRRRSRPASRLRLSGSPGRRWRSGCCACGVPRRRPPSASGSACRGRRTDSRSDSSTTGTIARWVEFDGSEVPVDIMREGRSVIAVAARSFGHGRGRPRDSLRHRSTPVLKKLHKEAS